MVKGPGTSNLNGFAMGHRITADVKIKDLTPQRGCIGARGTAKIEAPAGRSANR